MSLGIAPVLFHIVAPVVCVFVWGPGVWFGLALVPFPIVAPLVCGFVVA